MSALDSPVPEEESFPLDDSVCSAEGDTSPLDESSSLLDHDSLDEGRPPSLEEQPFNDIGTKVNSTRSVDAICQIVSNLSKDEKCALLCHHIEPPSVLPTTTMCGSSRKYNVSWLRRDKGLPVNRPYHNWSKLSHALSDHSLLAYHRNCLQEADTLRATMNYPTCRVDIMTNASVQVRINENKHIIRQIVRAVLLLAKQGLPFQGDDFKK